MSTTFFRHGLAGVAALAMTFVASAQDRQQGAANQSQANIKRASAIIGSQIEDAEGQKLGQIDNIAIDLESGRVVYAIIDADAALKNPDKLTAVPFKALQFSKADRPAKLQRITREDFDNLAQFNAHGWPTIGNREWGRDMHVTFGLEDQWDEIAVRGRSDRSQPLMLVKGTQVLGTAVDNKRNEELGQIKDASIDLDRAQVLYVALPFKSGRGEGDKLYAVPWQALTLNEAEKTFTIDYPADKLTGAPSFNKDNWPDQNDRRWLDNLHAFYGTDADWVYGYSSPSAADPREQRPVNENKPEQGPNREARNTDDDDDDDERESEDRPVGWKFNSSYGQIFDTGKIDTFNGKIVAVNRFKPMKGMAQGVLIKVKAGSDQEHVVHLGPAWFIDHQQAEFKEGDQVKVVGSKVNFEGKPIVMATEVHRGASMMKLRNNDGEPRWDAWHFANPDRNQSDKKRD